MGLLAFVINVGLFVKAKINLQNAADAAAFAGAAVQARQLTNIAYANWEIRNTYKEWMYKYYVLGQLSLHQSNFKNLSNDSNVSFLVPKPNNAFGSGLGFDKYNFPSICIHNNTNTDICSIFALPGIPRFPSANLTGVSDLTDAFINSIVTQKGKDCSNRSKQNFLTAVNWAYGLGDGKLPQAPLLASNRPGAFLESMELALRIRNLEMMVNRPPITSPITPASVQSLGNNDDLGIDERPIKAFWSAYRNLGGGNYKDKPGPNGETDELSANLQMTEIPPQVYHVEPNSTSGFLIPSDFNYQGPGGGRAIDKHYLDLQLVPINLATMFTMFVSLKNALNDSEQTSSEASCGMSKAALPVPGYIMGYVKNPEVLTYYAVKLETKFVGLFFPGSTAITLTAYAAAKPFGGRIGPMLYNIKNNTSIEARDDTNLHHSRSFISGIQPEAAAGGAFSPGMPIPSQAQFWVSDHNVVVGGIPGAIGANVFFGIPNMIYDLESGDHHARQKQGQDKAQNIKDNNGFTPTESAGLYHGYQFKRLESAIGPLTPGMSMTVTDITNSIVRARGPTRYDLLNYLVPDFREIPEGNNAANQIMRLPPTPDFNIGSRYQLFAPLIGGSLLYTNASVVKTIIQEYINGNQTAIDNYLTSLQQVAKKILTLNRGNLGGEDSLLSAATTIHINAKTGPAVPNFLTGAKATDATCSPDIASKINHFFRANSTECELIPLSKIMETFIQNANPTYFIGSYFVDDTKLSPQDIMSAYSPSARQGVAENDLRTIENAFIATERYSARRNYYSTKFVQMAKLMDFPRSSNMTKTGVRGIKDYEENYAFHEMVNGNPIDLTPPKIKNFILFSGPAIFNNSFFLDF